MPIERSSIANNLRSPEGVKENAVERRNELARRATLKPALDAAEAANDPDKQREIHIKMWNRTITKINEVSLDHAPAVKSAQDRITDSDRPITTEQHERIEKMTDALLNIPNADTDSFDGHRYLTARGAALEGTEPWFLMRANFKAAKADMEFLDGMGETFPEHKQDFAAIREAIDALLEQDPARDMHEWVEEKSDRFAARKGRELGSLSLALIGVTAAVFTGIGAIAQREFSFAPLLYGGIAALAANPMLRKSLFEGKAESTLSDASVILNNKASKETRKKYKIMGPKWQEVCNNIMDNPTETTQFTHKLEKNKHNLAPIKSDIDTYVTSVSSHPDVQSTIRNMINNDEFSSFANLVATAKKEDVKDIVSDYVKTGADKYAI